jgi:hypothetical protein
VTAGLIENPQQAVQMGTHNRLSELADYQRYPALHCSYKGRRNTKLGNWVGHQRAHYNLYIQGKTSPMTTFQNSGIGELRFLMGPTDAQWKQHLSELAGLSQRAQHCNVPAVYSKTTFGKLS